MTDPITPPTELIKEWMSEFYAYGATPAPGELTLLIATRAAQWGADQELEACCNWVSEESPIAAAELRAARRPKPPSLKELALEELNLTADSNGAELSSTQVELIQKALEALPND